LQILASPIILDARQLFLAKNSGTIDCKIIKKQVAHMAKQLTNIDIRAPWQP
jgi:hypothetical protein